MRVGLAITTYARGHLVPPLIESTANWTLRPSRIVVADNSPTGIDEVAADVLRWERNVGLPAALAACFLELTDVDSILVLDDDTILGEETLDEMATLLGPGVGAVSKPTDGCREVQRELAGPVRIFSWSPTLLRRLAIEATGLPREELFLIWDDWDYGVRMVNKGFGVSYYDREIPRQKMGDSMWPGRSYLRGRNVAYLYFHCRQRDPVFRTQLMRVVRESARSRVLARGVLAGLLGQSGPPPESLMPSVSGMTSE